jgi:hypothetical protein
MIRIYKLRVAPPFYIVKRGSLTGGVAKVKHCNNNDLIRLVETNSEIAFIIVE